MSPDKADRLFVRLFSRLFEEAEMLLLHGAQPVEIDEALKAFGFQFGVFELQDRIGTEVEYKLRKHRKAQGDWPEGYRSLISDRMVEEGRLGRQTVVGWYRYPGGKGMVEDPLIEDLVSEESHFARIQRQHFSAEEICDLLIVSLADEAISLAGEGEKECAVEIDDLSVSKLGFPAKKVGILAYFQSVGPAEMKKRYQLLRQKHQWLREPKAIGPQKNESPAGNHALS